MMTSQKMFFQPRIRDVEFSPLVGLGDAARGVAEVVAVDGGRSLLTSCFPLNDICSQALRLKWSVRLTQGDMSSSESH
jgi:hypothetical protein